MSWRNRWARYAAWAACAAVLAGLLSGCVVLEASAAGEGNGSEPAASQAAKREGFSYSSRLEEAEAFQTQPLDKVLSGGTETGYEVLAENESWIRPVASEAWEDETYKERYPDCALRVEAAQHRLFELPSSAATSFPFFVDLGLSGEGLEDVFGPEQAMESAGLLVVGARVKEIRVLGEQAAIVVEPARTGYQVIRIARTALPEGRALFQLVTPDGYEVDYLPLSLE